jgi:restriction system protein
MNDSPKAGYEYLLAYKITVPIYDLTVEFCEKWISKFSRTTDQMIQAARSGMTNLPEGYKQESLKGLIKLTGIERGSLEELLKDYLSFARQKKLKIWPKEKANSEISEINAIWKILKQTPTLPDSPDFPALPDDPEIAVNEMITLVTQANYLLDNLIKSLEAKFIKEGGFSENLLKNRLKNRKS